MNRIKKFLGALLLLAIFSCSEKKEKMIEEENTEIDSSTVVISKQSVFEWQNVLCTNEGTYNSEKYTVSQLKDTYKLWWQLQGYLNLDILSKKEGVIDTLTVEKLDKEYKERLQEFNNLKLVDEPYWQELKKNKLLELSESYELKKIAIQAYKHPQVLMENRFTKHCQEYALALSSQDDDLLLKTWQNLVEKQMEKNGAPDLMWQRFDQENASADRLIYARNQVMTYGWWNCANHVIYHFEDDGTPAKEFEKLFSDVKSECDEP